MGVLTQRVHGKLNTPNWKSLRDLFVQVGEAILEASPDAQGDLAGSYVKFTTGPTPTSPTYAAVWPRAARRLLVGLALPEDFKAEPLGSPPEQIFYPNLTKFLVIEEGQAILGELSTWAKLAYDAAKSLNE